MVILNESKTDAQSFYLKTGEPMNAQTFFRRIVWIIVIISVAIGTPNGISQAQAYTGSFQGVCRLPIGENGIHYSPAGIEDMLTWGPSALTIAPDGTFWISDNVDHALVSVTPDCQSIKVVKLPDTVVGMIDLVVEKDSIWILDQAAVEPAVYQLTMDGEKKAYYPVPADLQMGLSGIEFDQEGYLVVEQYNGYDLTRLLDSQSTISPASIPGYFANGNLVQVHLGATVDTSRQGWVDISGSPFDVQVSNDLGGISYLGSSENGTIYLTLEEVAIIDGTIQVDQTIRQYDLQGKHLGSARIPLAQQYTYVAHASSIGPDGFVYSLVTTPDGAEIVQLTFEQGLPDILPLPGELKPEVLTAEISKLDNTIQAISPFGIIANARGYINNRKYLSPTNTDGTCSGRSKPRYLGGSSRDTSVAYDWGGFDTVASFNSYMSPGTLQAGDINTTVESCSRGVDCSGFVSRAWGLTTKYSTSTLPSISSQLGSVGELQRGDILNQASSHVVLFDSFAPNGVNDFEATTYNSYDRVVYMFSSWSRLSGYVPRRYSGTTADSCSGQYRAHYYNGRNLGPNPSVNRCEGYPINFDWGGGSPVSGIGSDNFSVRWLGTANFSSGNYTFIARADDGIRVWFDQNLIIDAWRDQGPTEYRVSRYVSGGTHKIQVDYYENGGGAVAQFRWEGQQSASNLALGRPAVASSIQGSSYAAGYGNDGNNGTRWSSRIASSGDEWWRVDLGSVRNFNTVKVRWEAAFAAQYYVGWSNDGTNFQGYWYNIGSAGTYQHNLGARSARYVAIIARTRAPRMNNFSFWETEVYNYTLAAEQENSKNQVIQPDTELTPLTLPQQSKQP